MFVHSAKIRNLRLIRSLRALRNTFVPLPFAIVNRRLCFGSKIHVRQAQIWAEVGHYDWRSYKDLDYFSEVLVTETAVRAAQNDSILDICCNVGRNLDALATLGFSNLYGVDIMCEAIDQAPKVFPSLTSANLTCGNAVDYLKSLPSQSIDWAITQSATLELLHPNFRIHHELRRVLRRGLVFVISERGHSYPRFWRFLLKTSGFTEVRRDSLPGGLTLLSFAIS